MSTIVQLNDIVDALEMQFEESVALLDLDSGQVQHIELSLLSAAEERDEDSEDEPKLLAWEEDQWELAKEIASSDRFIRLPTKFDVHDWQIMQDFTHSVESEHIRRDLERAIHGAGAFRHFKDTIRRHLIEEAWFAFHRDALRDIAIEWCEDHDIKWS